MAAITETPSGFYVYTHARPDGRVFYVGKGSARRAWDFSPTRRTQHHINIVRKHGAKNIVIDIIPQPDEGSAFVHEIALIASYRSSGLELINLTNGGEGASGRPLTEEVAAIFARNRNRTWAERDLSAETIAAILEGMARGRANGSAWRKSEAGQAHLKGLYLASVAEQEARAPHEVVCACNKVFMAKHARATHCSRACALRAMRERRRDPNQKERDLVPYANSTTGVRGVYLSKNGTWIAMIGVGGKLIYLGRFNTKDLAAMARLKAEKQYGKPRNMGRPRSRL